MLGVMNLFSIPLHPLLVHAAVALVPAAALLAVAFVLRPDGRWLLRWPTAVTQAASVVALFAARVTGEGLMHQVMRTVTGHQRQLIETHDHWAGALTVATLGLAASSLLACWILPSTSALVSGRGARTARNPRLATPTTWLVLLFALATLLTVVGTGHAGAVATWSA